MPRPEDERNPGKPEKKERAPWGSFQAAAMKALAEPNPDNTDERRFPTDNEVVIHLLGGSLEGLSRTERSIMIGNKKGLLVTARKRFTSTILYDLDNSGAHPNAVTLALRVMKDIRAMYPERDLSPTDIATLVDRPKPRKPNAPFSSSSRHFESSRSTLDAPSGDVYISPVYVEPMSSDIAIEPATFMRHILEGRPGARLYEPSSVRSPGTEGKRAKG